MAKQRIAKETGLDTGNPFTLLTEAYRAGDIALCMDLLTNIYVYLCRQAPPRSLRRQWRKEFGNQIKIKDFVVKKVGKYFEANGKECWGGCYFVRLYKDLGAWLDYSSEASAVSIDGFRSNIAKRGRQLMGYREKVRK